MWSLLHKHHWVLLTLAWCRSFGMCLGQIYLCRWLCGCEGIPVPRFGHRRFLQTKPPISWSTSCCFLQDSLSMFCRLLHPLWFLTKWNNCTFITVEINRTIEKYNLPAPIEGNKEVFWVRVSIQVISCSFLDDENSSAPTHGLLPGLSFVKQ